MKPDFKKYRTAARIVTCVIWLAIAVALIFFRDKINADTISNFTPESDIAAFFIMLVIFALKSVSVFFYSGVIYAASGIIFPPLLAVFTNICGTVVMLLVSYWIGRLVFHSDSENIIKKNKLSDAIYNFRKGHDFMFSLLLRLLNIPYDVVSIYLGAVKIKFSYYLLGSLAGSAVNIVVFTFIGQAVSERSLTEAIIAGALQITEIVVGLVIIKIINDRNKRRKKI